LLNAIGLTPGGSSTVHIYTQTTQLTVFIIIPTYALISSVKYLF